MRGKTWRQMTTREKLHDVVEAVDALSRARSHRARSHAGPRLVYAFEVAARLRISTATARKLLRRAALARLLDAEPYIEFRHTGATERTYRVARRRRELR